MVNKPCNLNQLKQELSTLVGMEIDKLYLKEEYNNVLDPVTNLPIPESIIPKVATGYYRYFAIFPGIKPFEIKCSKATHDALVADKDLDNLVIQTFEVRTSKKGNEYHHIFFATQEYSTIL